MALTLKQRLWVEHYLGETNGNGTEAARRAGYRGNDDTLAHVAQDNLAHPEIAALIDHRVSTLAMTADECLALLAEVARLPVEWFATLGKDAKLSLGDKVRALELIGKHHRLFAEKQEIQTTNLSRIEIRSIRVAGDEPVAIDAAAWETPPPA